MREALNNVFEHTGLLHKLSARRKFYNATMQGGENIIIYINRVLQLSSTLKSMNIKVDDNELGIACLNGTPLTCENKSRIRCGSCL